MPNEQDLIQRLLKGEQAAYRVLVQQYQGAMRAVAIAIVGTASADEVVQDSWLAVVRNLNGFAGRASLKTWLLTITANTAKSRLRKQRREVLLDDITGPHGTIDDARFAADERAYMLEAARLYPPRRHPAYELRETRHP